MQAKATTTSFSSFSWKRRKGSYNKFHYGQQDDDDEWLLLLLVFVFSYMCNRVLMMNEARSFPVFLKFAAHSFSYTTSFFFRYSFFIFVQIVACKCCQGNRLRAICIICVVVSLGLQLAYSCLSSSCMQQQRQWQQLLMAAFAAAYWVMRHANAEQKYEREIKICCL